MGYLFHHRERRIWPKLVHEMAAATKHTLVYDIRKRNRTEIEIAVVTEFFPKVMGQTPALVGFASFGGSRATSRCLDRLIDGHYDVGNTVSSDVLDNI